MNERTATRWILQDGAACAWCGGVAVAMGTGPGPHPAPLQPICRLCHSRVIVPAGRRKLVKRWARMKAGVPEFSALVLAAVIAVAICGALVIANDGRCNAPQQPPGEAQCEEEDQWGRD